MRRTRRLAIILMTMSVVVAAVYATGAFSSLTATRDANIQIAGDASGYLSIQPAPGPNGAYASQRGGKLQISVGGALGGNGGGVNQNAVTIVRDIFTITNHGSQSVGVWLTDEAKAVTFKGGLKGTSERELEGKNQAVALDPGETLFVGLTVDTRDGKTPSITSVGIHASADVSGKAVDSGSTKPSSSMEKAEPSVPHSKPKETDRSGTKDDRSKTQDKSKQKSDGGGGFIDGIVNTGEAIYDQTKEAGTYIKNKVTGGLNWMINHAPGYIMQKLRSAANHPLSTIWNAGEEVWNFFVGAALGAIGMPSGGFTAKESNSPAYLMGWMVGTIVPGLEMATGVRDLITNAVNGKAIGAIIELIGLVPGLGAAENAADIYKTPIKWAKAFPRSTDEAFQMLKGAFLQNIPAIAREKILKAFGKSDETGALVVRETFSDMPKKKIVELKNKHGYSAQRMRRLVDNKGFTNTDIKTFAAKKVDLKRVENLRKNGFGVDDIRTLVKNDIDLKKAERLSKADFSADDIMFIAKNGEDTYPVRVSPKLKEDSVGGLVGRGGPTTDQLVTLRKQDIPVDDVRFYVENGVSLKAVSVIRKHVPGATPAKIKKRFRQMKFGQSVAFAGGKCRDTRGWLKEYNKRAESELDRADRKITISAVCE
jgi:hypothetical protein